MITLDKIRKNIITAIAESPKTQKEIAAQIEVCPQAIGQYLHQNRLPALDTFAKLCVALDLDANEVLGIK